jgi:hypothetical protein
MSPSVAEAVAVSQSCESFVRTVLSSCLDIGPVWSIGHQPGQDENLCGGLQLLAFGNAAVLERLRRSDRLHRPDIEFLVVVDGDRFVAAWGEALWSGSLSRWAWRQTAPREAHNVESGMVVRVRRRAVLVWPEPA